MPHYSGHVPQERFTCGENFSKTTAQATIAFREGKPVHSIPTYALSSGLSPTFKGEIVGFNTARKLSTTPLPGNSRVNE